MVEIECLSHNDQYWHIFMKSNDVIFCVGGREKGHTMHLSGGWKLVLHVAVSAGGWGGGN